MDQPTEQPQTGPETPDEETPATPAWEPQHYRIGAWVALEFHIVDTDPGEDDVDALAYVMRTIKNLVADRPGISLREIRMELLSQGDATTLQEFSRFLKENVV